MRSAPGAFLRTGVIVGHPGETDVEFDELCDFLQEFKFDRIFSFCLQQGGGYGELYDAADPCADN